jgi:hypothetical protein
MVYGSGDLAIVERYVPEDEFWRVLEDAPAGVLTEEARKRWHERFGIPVSSLPRRRFPDGSVGPRAGRFFGRMRMPLIGRFNSIYDQQKAPPPRKNRKPASKHPSRIWI